MYFPEKISDEDFFRLMKHRVRLSYSKFTASALVESLLFKETIEALRQLENFALEIKDGVWEDDLLTLKCKDPEIKQQLNDLLLKEHLFPYPEMFNHLFFQSVYKSYKIYDQLSDPDVDVLERRLPIIRHVRDLIERDIHKQFKRNKKVSNDLNRQIEIFDNLIRKHKSVYVLVIDIYLENFFKSLSGSSSLSGDMKISQIERIRMILAQLTPLHGITKFETHFKDGLNLHCILMLKPTKGFSEKNTIEMLRQYLQQVIGNLNHIDIRNWNTVIQKNYSKTAVGLIRATQSKNIAEFKYWILNFFYTLDLHIQPYWPMELKNRLVTNGILDTYIDLVAVQSKNKSSQTDTLIKRTLKDLEKANKAISKLVQPFFSEKDEKNVWNTRSSSSVSKGYIEAVMHYYREIESDEQKFQSMMHIEIFIETLISATQLKAFDLNDSLDHDQLTVQILRRAITCLGQRFILLGQNQVGCEYLKTIQYSKLCEAEAFQNSKKILLELMTGKISKDSIQDAQSRVLVLFSIFTKDHLYCDGKTIKEMRKDAYWKYKKRLTAASDLFRELMKQDCLIYRMTVELIPEVGNISQAELGVLWTAFVHHAQRSKPLSWKVGYFGLWTKSREGHYYADVFFVFDHRAFNDKNSIPRLLNIKWNKFIEDRKTQSKLKLNKNMEFRSCKIEGKLMMLSNKEYSLEYLSIESTNKVRKADFLQKVIPTFLSHSIFLENTLTGYKDKQAEKESKILMKTSIVVARKKKAEPKKLNKKKASSSPLASHKDVV